jgi:hypothetical protein
MNDLEDKVLQRRDAVVEEFVLEVLGILEPGFTLVLLSAKYRLTQEQLRLIYGLVQKYFS